MTCRITLKVSMESRRIWKLRNINKVSIARRSLNIFGMVRKKGKVRVSKGLSGLEEIVLTNWFPLHASLSNICYVKTCQMVNVGEHLGSLRFMRALMKPNFCSQGGQMLNVYPSPAGSCGGLWHPIELNLGQ